MRPPPWNPVRSGRTVAPPSVRKASRWSQGCWAKSGKRWKLSGVWAYVRWQPRPVIGLRGDQAARGDRVLMLGAEHLLLVS